MESKDIKPFIADRDKESSMETVTTAANLAIASRNAERRNETKTKNTIEEAVLTTMEETCMTNSGKFTTNTWIRDTGATSHMTNSDKGLTNVQIINERIKMGNTMHNQTVKRKGCELLARSKSDPRNLVQLVFNYRSNEKGFRIKQ